MSVKCSVVNHSVVISHPPNSPYLTTADFYLLLEVKITCKVRFYDVRTSIGP